MVVVRLATGVANQINQSLLCMICPINMSSMLSVMTALSGWLKSHYQLRIKWCEGLGKSTILWALRQRTHQAQSLPSTIMPEAT